MKPSTVSKLLLGIGILFIISGVISGFIVYDKEAAKDYKISGEVYDELYDNQFAEESYLTSKSIQKTNIIITATVVISGVISGVFFIGLSAILNVLIETRNINRRMLSSYN